MEQLEVRHKAALGVARAIDGMAALGLRWWEDNRPCPGALPAIEDALPVPLTLLVSNAYLVRAIRVSAAQFNFSLVQSSGTTCPDTAALMVFSAELRRVRKPLYDDLGFVVFSGSPSYHNVELGQSAQSGIRYRRLVLPLSKNRVSVDQLLVLAEPGMIEQFREGDHATASSSGSDIG